jgi:hypothetical protein
MRIAIWIGLICNFLLYGSGLAVATYYETPRAGEPWAAVLDGRTLVPLRWWQAQSAMIIVLDMYILLLPIPVISMLKLSPKRRLQVIGVFSLALLLVNYCSPSIALMLICLLHSYRGIGSAIASLIQRIEITRDTDQTWISAILTLCTYVL